MANIRSAKKRARRTERVTKTNRSRLTRVRNFVRMVEEAIGKGDKKAAQEALKAAQPELMRGAKKQLLHANTVSRKLSRLSSRIKAL